MARFDVNRVFENVPQIMGLDMVRRGNQWLCSSYINGEKHKFRRDKLKVTKWNNDIWIHEEGGESKSLVNWLVEYGGMSDYRAALSYIRGQRYSIDFTQVGYREPEKSGLVVGRDVVDACRRYSFKKCALFRWLVDLFGDEARVREVWDKYNVTTDNRGNAVFWYTDKEGRVLHDKRIAYKSDGHRDKSFGAWRRYTVGKGYDSSCLFGEHLWGGSDKVYICESEKTALLFYLYYGKPIMATGGKNGHLEYKEGMVLLPDMDGVEEWRQRGVIWEWWTRFPDVGGKADIGDAIVDRLRGRR